MSDSYEERAKKYYDGPRLGLWRTMRDMDDMPKFLQHVGGRNLVVQAGGNIGVFPKALSKHFRRVITFEPLEENFKLLKKRVHKIPNVLAINAALGNERCDVGMNVSNWIGEHTVNEGGTGVRMVVLDDFHLDECDLLWLDVELYENHVLDGAINLIERFSPPIIIEGKTASRWLRHHGYQQAMQIRNDRLWVR
jgi:FkbM family methyltransferase